MGNAKEQLTTDKKQARNVVRSAIILAAVSFVMALFVVAVSLPLKNLNDPAKLTIIMLALTASALALIGGWIYARTQKYLGIYILIGTLLIATILQVFLISGISIWMGIFAIIITAAIASQTLPPEKSNRIIVTGIIIAVATILLDQYYPLPRLSGDQQLQVFVALVMGLAIALHIASIIPQFLDLTLRVKLIVTFILLSVLAILILGISYSLVTRNALTKSTNNSLQIAAQQTANSVDGFYRSMLFTLKTEADSTVLHNYIALSTREGTIQAFNSTELLRSYQQTNSALGYSVLSVTGTVLIDTASKNSTDLGFNIVPTATYTSALTTSGYYLSPIIYPNDGDPYIFAMTPIKSDDGQIAGILMARYAASVLQDLVAANNNLIGVDSYAILWDENKIRLANGFDPSVDFKLSINPGPEVISQLQAAGKIPNNAANEIVLQNDSLSKGLDQIPAGKIYFTAYETRNSSNVNGEGRKMIAAATKMNYQPWTVTFLQAESTAFAPITRLTRITVIIAIGVVLAVCVLGIFVAQMFTRPIIRLTKTAVQVTGGNLNARAEIIAKDEIGSLASAFNLMTSELSQTLANLENRVANRTSELELVSKQMEKRADQLQTVAQVAHAISAFKDPDLLLQQITLLISERFGFYHVGVFLLDKAGEYAVLQAANSEGGRHMLERGHRLEVGGTSMVGHVAKLGQARVALDVGKDAVFFDNPDLPLTRSEISLPLHSGETMMGVLDVQSEQPSAFTEEDIALLSTLADQVSIAIENARLFSDISQSMGELQTLQRQYLQQEWQRLSSDQLSGYQYSFGKIAPLPKGLPDNEKKDITPDNSQLVIPIALRGQQIGAFNLVEMDGKRQWSAEEIAFIKTIADQVGLALENARLLEVTQHRAARDRMVADITNKMRRAVDMDTLIQTAVREITNAVNVPEAFVQLGVHAEAMEKVDSQPTAETSVGETQPGPAVSE